MVGCFALPLCFGFRVTVVHVAGCWSGFGGRFPRGRCVSGIGSRGFRRRFPRGRGDFGSWSGCRSVDGRRGDCWRWRGPSRGASGGDNGYRQSGSGVVVRGLLPPSELGRCRESSTEAVVLRLRRMSAILVRAPRSLSVMGAREPSEVGMPPGEALRKPGDLLSATAFPERAVGALERRLVLGELAGVNRQGSVCSVGDVIP
jgi:hypothetical protein